MLARVAKTLGALLLAVAFVLNGAVMQLGHAKVSSTPMAMSGTQIPVGCMALLGAGGDGRDGLKSAHPCSY